MARGEYVRQKFGGKIAGATLRKVGASNVRAVNVNRLTQKRSAGKLGKVTGLTAGKGGLK